MNPTCPDYPNYPETVNELKIDVAGYTLAALRTQTSDPDTTGRHKLLCVHGWLDNAASFIPLMTCTASMQNADIVAIDLPGHGYSTTLGETGYPNFLELGLLLPQIVSALGWQQCHLIGHSLGANLALAAAVAAPQVFTSLVMLESLGPPVETSDKLPARLQKALHDRVDTKRFESRRFEHPGAAVSARLAATRMSKKAAELIIARQLESRDGGYVWRFDPRFRYASPFYLTEAHVESLLQSVEQPTLVVLADNGILSDKHLMEKRLGKLREHTVSTLSGNHHMHMDAPEEIIRLLNDHLSQQPSPSG